jgi:hypothetical protein
MSNSLLSSPWAALFLKPTPDGQIFTWPSPWLVGDQRAYSLSNAQAEQLMARLGRAYRSGVIGVSAILVAGIGGAVGLVHLLADNPNQFFDSHPIGGVIAVVVFTLLSFGLYFAYLRRVVATVLAGLPWTVAPRQPHGSGGQVTIAFEALLPTWALAIFFIVFLVGIVFSGVPAMKALAAGQLTFELLQVVLYSIMALTTGAALIAKLKRPRAGK